MVKLNGVFDIVIIKKYVNWWLYDILILFYVIFDYFFDLVCKEIDFEVVDVKIGDDLMW